jgi:hypothetical protein
MVVLAVILGLLSIAAGAAKITLVPEEAAFLHQFGFAETLIIAFGLVQALGGALLVVPRTRAFCALICAAGFALSAGPLLVAGNLAFGGVSLLPVGLSGFVACQSFVGRPVSQPIGNDAKQGAAADGT